MFPSAIKSKLAGSCGVYVLVIWNGTVRDILLTTDCNALIGDFH